MVRLYARGGGWTEGKKREDSDRKRGVEERWVDKDKKCRSRRKMVKKRELKDNITCFASFKRKFSF